MTDPAAAAMVAPMMMVAVPPMTAISIPSVMAMPPAPVPMMMAIVPMPVADLNDVARLRRCTIDTEPDAGRGWLNGRSDASRCSAEEDCQPENEGRRSRARTHGVVSADAEHKRTTRCYHFHSDRSEARHSPPITQ